MPRLPFSRTIIDVPVCDRQFGDTLIKQRARFTTLTHEQNLDGTCRVAISVVVTMHATVAGEYGEPLAAPGFTARPYVLAADNSALVDVTPGATFGAILARRGAMETEQQWLDRTDTFAQPTMLQGDFFEYLRENQDVRIGDLIRQHITQSDAAPSTFA